MDRSLIHRMKVDKKVQRLAIPVIIAAYASYVLSVAFKNNYDRRDYLQSQRLVEPQEDRRGTRS